MKISFDFTCQRIKSSYECVKQYHLVQRLVVYSNGEVAKRKRGKTVKKANSETEEIDEKSRTVRDCKLK